jgi:hypothetical protein
LIKITSLVGSLICQPAAPSANAANTDFSSVLEAHLDADRVQERSASTPAPTSERTIDRAADRTIERTGERTLDRTGERTTERSAEQPASDKLEREPDTDSAQAAASPKPDESVETRGVEENSSDTEDSTVSPEDVELSIEAAALSALSVVIAPAQQLSVQPAALVSQTDATAAATALPALPTLDASALHAPTQGALNSETQVAAAPAVTAQLTELRVVQEDVALPTAQDTFVTSSPSSSPLTSESSSPTAPLPLQATGDTPPAPAATGSTQLPQPQVQPENTPPAAVERPTPLPTADAQEVQADDAPLSGVAPLVRTVQGSQAADGAPALERAIVTENIRSEVWEIAKRAQALSRVEAVIHTTLGDLSVVARHTANGVSVVLSGDAASNLDLSSLQRDLQGLNVSVDDRGSQPRAREWDEDTVPTRASMRQEPTTPTIQTRRASNGQLDIHA